ncbi:hypothetical protein [Sediminispirochaeta smaragdinae]|uniref:Uncharacterized protein n=1 Tax=Sediminispirochaeta smaragdinae (strain DSM 11293 / JCM 15392 / SEBR 4228) TaxID=573413 RepID=E1RBB4_SEDSS|nr:hypothetical protein [Sediminispirochaeta smaragdinae]ADK79644.1 conserved hypothetical protein [Sediminispirochaeta smaragdinae DSM 11293]
MRQFNISGKILALSIVLLFGLSIGGSMIIGYWRTESSKIPTRIESGPFAGAYDPAAIKGSYTFENIESAFKIPVAQLAEAFVFAVSGEPETTQPKSFEAYPQPAEGEVGTDSMRLFVSLYTSIPYEAEEDTRLPYTALALLRREGKLDEARWAELKDRYGVEMESPNEVPKAPTSETGSTLEIKGNTTYGQLFDAGLTTLTIEEVIGIKAGNRDQVIRDHLGAAGLEFSQYKALLQKKVDNVQK